MIHKQRFTFNDNTYKFAAPEDYGDLPTISHCIEDGDIPTISPEMDNSSMRSFSKKDYYKENVNGWWKPEIKDINEFKKEGLISASISECETSTSEISIGIKPEKIDNPLMMMRRQILQSK